MVSMSEETISKQIIKPSSPTPTASRTLPLSFLDQIQRPFYPPMIFFYENDSNSELNQDEVSSSLKRSLSETLTVFYPIAGKLRENSFIDCDDSGVEFAVARVRGRGVAQFRADPKQEELRLLIPVEAETHSDEWLMFVKLSFLDCGGFALCVCMTHKVGDFPSFATLMNAWAAVCRGETHQIMSQPFDLHRHFPPKETAPVYFTKEKGKTAAKRVIFDKEALEKIRKQEGGRSAAVPHPSRVEAVSAFIWKIFMAATKAKRDPNKSSFAALHAVNLRQRTVPPLPDSTFGNCYVGAFAFVSEGGDVLSSLRAAIAEVDDSYIRNVINDAEYLRVIDDANRSFQRGDTVLCNFSSWWRSPVYGADYGWGKPAWICPAGLQYNLVVLMSTPSGDGMEAWIYMPEDFSETFESSFDEIAPLINI